MAQTPDYVSLEHVWKRLMLALTGRNGSKIIDAKAVRSLIDWRLKH